MNVNKGLQFETGEEWKGLDMRAVGGGTIPTFTTNLKEVRLSLESKLKQPFGSPRGCSYSAGDFEVEVPELVGFPDSSSSRCSTRTMLPSSS